MYNLAIRGHDISKAASVEEMALFMKTSGISNIQFAMNVSLPGIDTSGPALSPGMGTYFKNLFARNGIQIGILSCYSNLIHPDLKERESILKKFESYLRHAQYFGAPMVASETGSVIPELGYTTANFTDEVFQDLVHVVNRLVKSGERYNTIVAIEAGLNHPLYSVDRTKELIDSVNSDFLGIILDPTNLVTAATHESMVSLVTEAFELYGDKIVALHLKDYVIENNQIRPVCFGDGIIRYQEILDIVSKKKPYCYIVLEETKDEGILKARKILNG